MTRALVIFMGGGASRLIGLTNSATPRQCHWLTRLIMVSRLTTVLVVNQNPQIL
jgi:hypothetical protein